MRDRGTLNPGNQHLTHLMLMSGIIINISHTHTHTQTYTETPCSPSHHLTYISTGGKFYPRAQCQHVCINKSTQNAHRVKELILSHYPFFSLYHSFMNSPSGSPSICPSASNPAKPQFISSSTGEPRLISQRCLVPRRANARSLPSVISPPSLFTLCFCSFFPLIHLWYISAFEVRCDTIKRLPFLPNSFTRHRGWGPCGDPTFRSSPQPAQHSALNPGRAKVDQSKCNFLQDYT